MKFDADMKQEFFEMLDKQLQEVKDDLHDLDEEILTKKEIIEDQTDELKELNKKNIVIESYYNIMKRVMNEIKEQITNV